MNRIQSSVQRQVRADGASNLVRTRFGIEFDASDDVWPIDGSRELDVGAMRSLVTPGLLLGLEMTLREAATRYSWSTLNAYRYALKHFQVTCFPSGVIEQWSLGDLRPYRAVLIKAFGHEDYLRHIRSLLVNWQKGRRPGVSKELIDSLQEMKLIGVEAGRSVRVMDPDKGPLTPDERHNLIQSLHDAAEAGFLTLDEYSLAYLHVMTGRRPLQTAQLKCKDLVMRAADPEPAHPQGRPQHLLAIPRAKQRGHAFRETLRAIDLSPENFQIYTSLRDSVQERFRARLNSANWVLQAQDLRQVLGDLPLYPNWKAVEMFLEESADVRSAGKHGQALEAMRRDSASAAWHPAADDHAERLIRICGAVKAQSQTGTLLKVTAARLRHTKGTDLARDGLSTHIIAWLLDHSTSRSADIYVDNLPEHAAEINGAMSKSTTLQRFASAFRGEVVASEADAVGGNDPQHSRLAYRGQGTATCGLLKQCGLDGGVPHACYTCSHFQPWVDGPHEQFLADLLIERVNTLDMLGADSAVAKRRDKLIAAVESVVELCRVRRNESLATASAEAAA